MKKEKLLIALFIIIIISCIVISVIVLKKDKSEELKTIDGLDLVDNQTLLQESLIDDIKISDIIIINGEETSNYKAKVTNTNNTEYYINSLVVTFTINGDEYSVNALSDVTLSAYEERYLDIAIDQELSNASKIEYRIDEEDVQDVNSD